MTDLTTSQYSTGYNSRDFSLQVSGEPPAGYPTERKEDTFSSRPFAPYYRQRVRAYLDLCQKSPAPANFKAPFYELTRLAAGRPFHTGIIEAALDYIQERKDCADFLLHAILRMLYQYPGSPRITTDLLERCKQTVLDFKYWPDEPGVDSLCTWTENHQILYASAALLAGQLYPQETFTNSGQTGHEKIEQAKPRIMRWLDLRFRSGFSEWLSNVYYDEDLTALLSLVDFCQDAEIRRRAEMVIDLILLDMALNSYAGAFASTHGRSYELDKINAGMEATSDTSKLVFGMGRFALRDNMSAVCFALSPNYRPPKVLQTIAANLERPEILNRQRMGIKIAEAEKWGLGFNSFEDGMVYLSLEAYTHPRTIQLVMRMFDRYCWWQNSYFAPFAKKKGLINFLRRLGLLPTLAKFYDWDLNRNTREEVNLITYRTPDYQLSSAVDYRPGYGGDQQHIWQASFGPEAVCFTTHPNQSEHTPSQWVGSGTLPRVAQVKNVLAAIYRIDTRKGLYLTNRSLFTHAWLPRSAFDEVIERGGWIFARKGDGYLALRSQQPYQWNGENEIVAQGKENIWLCELGRAAVDGEFAAFIERILQAPLKFGRLKVEYGSPSQGNLSFGWKEPLLQNGQAISQSDFPRYDNPYVQASFPSDQIEVRAGDNHLRLDWKNAKREEA